MRKLELGLLLTGALLLAAQTQAQVDYVDPTIGGVGYLLQPTRPTVSLPNCPLRFYPVRSDALDDQVHSFPLTIIDHRQGELFWLMPAQGPVNGRSWQRPAAYDQEVTTPTLTNGLIDGGDVTYSAVTGSSVEAIVLYRKNAGANTTWRLVAYIDTGVTGLPVTPNGGDIGITFNASGILQL